MKRQKSLFFSHFSFIIFPPAWRRGLLSFVLILLSCQRTTQPLYDPANLQIEVLDVSCTEAWLRLKANPAFYGKMLRLYGNDSLIVNKQLTVSDSLLYTDGLQPATTYAFRANVMEGGKQLASGAKVSAATMDTTSHNFEWQTREFGGQGGSSSFFDVAIIDENDIWAVGDIYTADDKYNAAHWDGEKWELRKIYFYYQGKNYWGPIYAIFSFNKNDVWFGMGSLIHWNGSNFKSYKIPDSVFPSRANKIWGISDSDLYVVGNSGLIAHYDGQEWTRIETPEGAGGTNLKIQDIYGAGDNESGDTVIAAIASNPFTADGNAFIEIKETEAFYHSTGGLPNSLTGVWSPNGKRWYLSGDGIYRNYGFGKNWQRIQDVPAIYSEAIRGTAYNNIFVAGHLGLLLHWNGYSWKDFTDKNVQYYGLAVKGNIIVAVGTVPQGIVAGPAGILIGKIK